MRYRAIIKKMSAGLLLAVFMLAITPKKTIHDWIVDHKDSTVKQFNSPSAQIGNPFFSCACDDLVAESAFEPAASFFIRVLPQYALLQHAAVVKIVFAPSYFTALRGPPVQFQA